jgi:hypothetical protein
MKQWKQKWKFSVHRGNQKQDPENKIRRALVGLLHEFS